MTKKKILAIILCIMIVLGTVYIRPISNAASNSASFSLTADKTTVNPGDKVTFTVYLTQHDGGLTAFSAKIPTSIEGLTYVAGSGVVDPTAITTFGFDGAVQYAENTKEFSAYSSVVYEGTAAVKIGTFQLEVSSDATEGAKTVALLEPMAIDESYDGEKDTSGSSGVTITIEKPKTPATGISVSPKTLEVQSGETAYLAATLTPSTSTDTITWSSSDSEVVSVNASTGAIKAQKSGSATVTATATSGVHDACTVTVTCSHANTTSHPAEASTCTVQGHGEYVTCDDCGAIVSGSSDPLPLAEHQYGDLIPEVPAVHGQTEAECVNGTKAHYQCSACNKLFDENKVETNEAGLVIPAKVEHTATSDEWTTNATQHWKVCGCGIKMNVADHTGGEATCIEKAKCEVCGVEYGELNPDNHKHTEVKDAKEATCTEKGYTGDTYCKDCDEKISDGNDIDALGHTGGEATCVNKAVCTRCGEEYGDLDPNNHKHTEVRDAKESTTTEKGYTGDTYCTDCDSLVKKGEEIPLFVYEMVEGEGATHELTTDSSIRFKSNGKLEKLTSVKVDNKELSEKDYTKESGSTIVTLKADYLNTLAIGTHTLALVYDDGEVTSNFKIAEKAVVPPTNGGEVTTGPATVTSTTTTTTITTTVGAGTVISASSPSTGDNSQMLKWISGSIISMIGVVIIVKWNEKEKTKGKRTLRK